MKIDKKESERVGIKVLRTADKKPAQEKELNSEKKKNSVGFFDEKEFKEKDE